MPRGVVLGLSLCTRLPLRSEEAEEHGLEELSLRKKIRNSTGPDLLFLYAERSANAIGALRVSRKPVSALVVVADCALSPLALIGPPSATLRRSSSSHKVLRLCGSPFNRGYGGKLFPPGFSVPFHPEKEQLTPPKVDAFCQGWRSEFSWKKHKTKALPVALRAS